MPRHPKPAALRQNTERRDFGLIRGGRRGDPPPPPAGMRKAQKDSWASFWRSPLAKTVVPDTDMPALNRLWRLYEECDTLANGVKRKRMVMGSQGQPVLNPLHTRLASVETEIRQLEDRFGLTPLARLKLGVVLGDAARSLDDLNAEIEEADEEEQAPDPRVVVVEGRAG